MLSIINFIQVGDSFRAIKLCSSYQINVKMAQIFLNFTTVPGKVQGQIGRYACLTLMNERFFFIIIIIIIIFYRPWNGRWLASPNVWRFNLVK